MSMHNPAHPGEILKELMIEPLGLSITNTRPAFRGEQEDSFQVTEQARRSHSRNGIAA